MGQLHPFRFERRFTPCLCLSLRTSYPLPRFSTDFAGGSFHFSVQFEWRQSTPSVHAAQRLIKCASQTQKRQSFQRQGVNRRSVTPFGVVRGFTPRHRVRFEGRLPPPARVASTDLVGNPVSFGADSAGSLRPPRTTTRSRVVKTQTLIQSRFRTRVHWADTKHRTPGVGHQPGSHVVNEVRARHLACEKQLAHVSWEDRLDADAFRCRPRSDSEVPANTGYTTSNQSVLDHTHIAGPNQWPAEQDRVEPRRPRVAWYTFVPVESRTSNR